MCLGDQSLTLLTRNQRGKKKETRQGCCSSTGVLCLLVKIKNLTTIGERLVPGEGTGWLTAPPKTIRLPWEENLGTFVVELWASFYTGKSHNSQIAITGDVELDGGTDRSGGGNSIMTQGKGGGTHVRFHLIGCRDYILSMGKSIIAKKKSLGNSRIP